MRIKPCDISVRCCCIAHILLLAISTPAQGIRRTVVRNDRDLIGWSEQFQVQQDDMKQRKRFMHEFSGPEVLSWEPRIVVWRNFLTENECQHLIDKATPRLVRSGVVARKGESDVSNIRTSYGTFLGREEDDVVKRIENKISQWALIPPGNGEGIQVLRYEKGQEYKPHFDYFFHKDGESNGGNRLATVLMYLTTPEKGGETIFPNVHVASPSENSCGREGLAVKARRGDAVLFFSLRTDGVLDKGSLHGGCPVESGVKFAATKWFHVGHVAVGGERAEKVSHVVFRPSPPPAPAWCKDKSEECPGWAESGECESNAAFMLGNSNFPGNCLRSCGRCDLMNID